MPAASVACVNSVLDAHPIFSQFQWQSLREEPAYVVGPLGVYTRKKYYAGIDWQNTVLPTGFTYHNLFSPGINEEIFEWIDVLEAICFARNEFTMIELGCSHARWLVQAAFAARQRGVATKVTGVEAEPTHFRWAREHLSDNGLDRKDALHCAAVDVCDGSASFYTGLADAWYGQALAPPSTAPTPLWTRLTRALTGQKLKPMDTVARVKTISLRSLLRNWSHVDLLDFDIQGSELDVVASAPEALDARVRRVHVGTHSAEIEAGLRRLFTDMRWVNLNDYECLRDNDTPYGRLRFNDGVQTWLNPRLN